MTFRAVIRVGALCALGAFVGLLTFDLVLDPRDFLVDLSSTIALAAFGGIFSAAFAVELCQEHVMYVRQNVPWPVVPLVTGSGILTLLLLAEAGLWAISLALPGAWMTLISLSVTILVIFLGPGVAGLVCLHFYHKA